MSFGTTEILKDFSFSVRQGEFVTVIGSSGCGKTTLLKLINGLLIPREGMVCVMGNNLAHADLIQLRRKIGYVIQDTGLFPHMTVEKNIGYVPDLEDQSNKSRAERTEYKRQLRERVMAMMHTVGLEPEMMDRYPEELSGGQRQRVGIARALIAEPEILLMDEPFGAVDGITRRRLQEEILEIARKIRCTIVFITHDINEALKLGSRVIVMDEGKILQDASPVEVKTAPATEFVRELTKM